MFHLPLKAEFRAGNDVTFVPVQLKKKKSKMDAASAVVSTVG